MEFGDMLGRFAGAVEAGDSAALAALFTEDGVYHDVFYGAFRGREAIAGMVRDLFHRDGQDFRWEFRDPVCDGRVGYAAWLFSYTARTRHAAGARVIFDGVGLFRLKDGLIAHYEDVCNGCLPLRQMGAPPNVMARMLEKWQRRLEARPGYSAHRAPGGGERGG